eukprot:4424984-Prymnesium_polylepis.1
MAPEEVRVGRALDNCRLAIDMHEMFERVAINNHGSFLPHGAIFKISRDILCVADVWACGTSPLELQNAETKRASGWHLTSARATSRSSGRARTRPRWPSPRSATC